MGKRGITSIDYICMPCEDDKCFYKNIFKPYFHVHVMIEGEALVIGNHAINTEYETLNSLRIKYEK